MDLIVLQHGLPSVRDMMLRMEKLDYISDIKLYVKTYSHIAGAVAGFSATELNGPLREPPAGMAPNILVLDEGGWLHPAFGDGAAGVEQTTSGLRQEWRYPVVLLCRSAAKLYFESQIIARGIIRKLVSLDLLDGRAIGVIGLGALGSELVRQLQLRGCKVSGADREQACPHAVPVAEVLHGSDLLLGCTGADALRDMDLSGLCGTKVFASCSSSDVEFRSLLVTAGPRRRFAHTSLALGEADCVILNGGYPINFDREREWESADEILLTRWLAFAGIEQASRLVGAPAGGVMLDPGEQLRLTLEWLNLVPDQAALVLPPKLDVEFFRSRSEGELRMTDHPDYQLHSTTPGALSRMRAHSEPYEVEVAARAILVLPGVWSPRYDWSSLFYIENFPEVSGRSFLEIGSGTGVISVFAGLNGASRVVAVDVNDAAVRNTKLNFERFGLKDAVAMRSDGFEAIGDKFDLITWNAPYHGARPADMLERGCADEDYRDIRAFFGEVTSHLAPGGQVVFGFSESGDLPLIERLIGDAGLKVQQKFSDWREDYNCLLFILATEREAVGAAA